MSPGVRPKRIGVVLGAGGTLGAAWLAGALEALHEDGGLDLRDAEVIVGTSAGSAVGALAAHGVAPAYLSAYACGRPLEGLDPGAALPEDASLRREAAIAFRPARALPSVGPGSWRMAIGTLARAHRRPPASVVAGWLPRGVISTDPLREGFRHLLGERWPSAPELWTVAVSYDHRCSRTVFGRAGSPEAELADAVAASCAIPGFYRPVRIGGRDYVDGGVCSPSNLDLLAGRGLDLVVALNPMSSRATLGGRSPGARAGDALRAAAGRRLGSEARKVRAGGTSVLLVQPGPREVAAMGLNVMRRAGRAEIADLAARSVMGQLRTVEARAALASVRTRPGRPVARRAAAA